jgi:hypothetical protein
MIRFLLLICLSSCFCISSFAQIDINDLNIVFQQDFNDDQLGDYTGYDLNNDWNHPQGTQRQDLVDILTDGDKHGKYMRGYFPVGKIGAVESGWTWNTALAGYTELYFSYDLRFKSGFIWVLGGKIPGITGGKVYAGSQPAYNDGFSVRGMWAPDGTLVYYLYHQDRQSIYGEPILWPDFNFVAGQWYNITFRVVLNSVQNNVGFHDGILEGFINGKLIFQRTNINFRNFENIKIDNISNCSFFGGAETAFNPKRDEWLDLDNFIAYTYKNNVPDVPRSIQPSLPSRVLFIPDMNSSHDTVHTNIAAPYKISSSSATCYSSDNLYVPLIKSAVDTLKDCIGYDLTMTYNRNLVIPTGNVRFNSDLTPDVSLTGYTMEIMDSAVNISIYLNPGNSSAAGFNGTGQVMSVEFMKTGNLNYGDTAKFTISSLVESYADSTRSEIALPGIFTTSWDSTILGSLSYWSDNIPITNEKTEGDSMIVTNIFSSDSLGTRRSSRAIQPDLYGNFNCNIRLDKFIQIERDIPGSTDMMPVVNGLDAQIVRKVLVQDPTFKPTVYQIIAMDVNMDGMISAGDLTQINKRTMLILGEYQQAWNYNDMGTSNGLSSKDWLFIPNKILGSQKDYRISATYPDDDQQGYSRWRVPLVPHNLPLPVADLVSCQQIENEGYKAILLGDVDGNYKRIGNKNGLKSTVQQTDDRVIFDMACASTHTNNLDIHIDIRSDNPVYSLDLTARVNTNKIRFQSVIGNSEDIVSSSVFDEKDKTLRLTSNSLKPYHTDISVMSLRFAPVSGKFNPSDILVTNVYVNGEPVSFNMKASREPAANENPDSDDVQFYPNPASSYLLVKAPAKVNVQIIDITGKMIEVNSLTSNENEVKLDIQLLQNGIYLVKILYSNQTLVKKLIVAH